MRLLPFDYAVRNLGRSPARLAGIIGGNAIVVLLIIAAAAFVEGMRSSLSVRHSQRNVILMGVGSEESVERSEIPATSGALLAASVPGLRAYGGVPAVSPEVVTALVLQSSPQETSDRRAVVRGVGPAAFLVHPQVEIVTGRAPEPGTDEVMVGGLAAKKIGLRDEDLAVGKSLWLDDKPLVIVGTFRAPGTVMDAEIWMPLTDLLIATKRETISCVVATLDTAEFADIDAFTKVRVDLELSAVREADYYASLQRFYRPVRWMIWITAGLVAVAGLLGGLNTLFAAFAARVREIGMLQSLGYSRTAIVWSLVQESLLASCGAALAAMAAAWLLLDGAAVRFSMGVFQLSVGGSVLATGLGAALLIGVAGALPPAWKCLRLPIPEALKAA